MAVVLVCTAAVWVFSRSTGSAEVVLVWCCVFLPNFVVLLAADC